MKWGELAGPREDNWRKIPITLTTKIFGDRDSARTGQGLCDPAPNGQFCRGSPRRREKRLPRGIAGDVYPSMPYNSSRDAG